jgi:pimeloyl-ACP methyl ester carboxylesterase
MDEQASFETIAKLSRRAFLATAAAAGLGRLAIAQSTPVRDDIVHTDFSTLPAYGNGTIPAGIRSRQIANVNGMTVHILEAGYETPGRPAILHGFPELAYSWRKVMPSLAAAGYHVIAPDQRGYGRTIGWGDSYDADPDPFRILNMTRDAIGLVYALGHRSVAMVVGHDAGAPVASWSALIRPDIFRSITIMSSPFEGAPSLPFDTANGAPLPRPAFTDDEFDAELAKLNPPRKYYQNLRTRGANDDMLHAPQGLHAFFRAYYFYKSADYKANNPHPLKARTAEEMAQIPTYYVMEKDRGMAETVAPFMPPADYIANCKWLTDAEVEVYATEFGRTGFTGALQGYRVRRGSDPKSLAEMQTFSVVP